MSLRPQGGEIKGKFGESVSCDGWEAKQNQWGMAGERHEPSQVLFLHLILLLLMHVHRFPHNQECIAR